MPPDRPVRSASSGGSPLPATPVPEVRVTPRLRGVFHQHAFFASLASGTVLVLLTTTTKASVAAAIYAASVSALFGVSALYHRVTWSTPARRRMRRLDHAMIFLLIAGPCAAPTPCRPPSAITRSSTCWSSPGSPPTSWPSACSRCPPGEHSMRN